MRSRGGRLEETDLVEIITSQCSTGGMDFLCGCHSRSPAIGIEVFGGVDREQLAKTTTAFLSCRRRTVGAELLRQPAPQHVKKLEAPASQASPVLGIRTDTESISDRSFPPPFEQLQPECFQDDAGGVPASRVEEVGKDAQGLAAAAAKVAADSEDDLFGRDKPEHLSQVRAVSNDPQRLAGRRSRLAASRTACRPESIDRRKEFGITSDAKQALDVVEEALYDDHRLCVQGGGAKIAKSDASSPFFFHKSPRRRHRTGGEVAEKLQEP